MSNFIDDEPIAALSIQWSPTLVLRFSKPGHIERNTHPFRIEGFRADARKQEVGILEKIRVGSFECRRQRGSSLEGDIFVSWLTLRFAKRVIAFIGGLGSLG